jgi:hypothetical protein
MDYRILSKALEKLITAIHLFVKNVANIENIGDSILVIARIENKRGRSGSYASFIIGPMEFTREITVNLVEYLAKYDDLIKRLYLEAYNKFKSDPSIYKSILKSCGDYEQIKRIMRIMSKRERKEFLSNLMHIYIANYIKENAPSVYETFITLQKEIEEDPDVAKSSVPIEINGKYRHIKYVTLLRLFTNLDYCSYINRVINEYKESEEEDESILDEL